VPLYDYECQDQTCGHVFETITGVDDQIVECPRCGFNAKRIITVHGACLFNQDAPWIRSVLEVVDKDSPKPETQEFLKRPTRDNYYNWMRAEGIRPMDSGERPRRPEEPNMERIQRDMVRRYKERERVSL